MFDDANNIPFPFRFNAFKHHRGYILEVLERAPASAICEQLKPLCNNYVDVYTGCLPISSICREIISILQGQNILELGAFRKWVWVRNGYRELLLSDGSHWVVREGNETERYIHVHPGRRGPNVARFKGSTIKSVFLLKLEGIEEPTLEDVNRLRQQIGLSPVRRLEVNKGILKCYRDFFG